MKGAAVFFIFPFLCCAACTQKLDAVSCTQASDLLAMRAMKLQRAEFDAVRDSDKGDHRLLGIHSGVGLIVPGLATKPDTSGYGLRIIEGTDIPCHPDEDELNANALRYAKIYNKKKMQLWQSQAPK
ncbi:hypothetical protein [Dyella choica]|uniref:Uncharacterized protein n=1 Tax=Dyella choica TaxID=1927959 RepID=A0A3S0R3X2_9GAMM|nr:hypothetical protein [Dyella choica]RUL75963.1 hypothetical protein EKH80_09570 [Dyella choica]